MNKGKTLQQRLSTVFSEYAPRVHSAAEDAEQRLTELEERDRARARRERERREALRDKYPSTE
jgi:hypothetical protein